MGCLFCTLKFGDQPVKAHGERTDARNKSKMVRFVINPPKKLTALCQCQNIEVIMILIFNGVHGFLHHKNSKPANIPLIGGKGDARIRLLRWVIGMSVVGKTQ